MKPNSGPPNNLVAFSSASQMSGRLDTRSQGVEEAWIQLYTQPFSASLVLLKLLYKIDETSIERLLISEQREEWMLQVSSELETLGGSIPGPNAFVVNEKWMRTEFRKKLLGGSDFHFKDQVSTVQLIVIRIPEAIGDTIFL